MIYTSSKRIELGSTAFRQPNADSHCKFVHGYQLNAEITFGCKELDNNNWVYDFGGLKELKSIFNNQFDHTLVIAANDVHKDKFIALNEVGAADVRIMEGGVGIEKFAEWVFKTADTYIDETTEGRVWVENVTVYEHGNNSASCSRPTKVDTLYKNEEGTTTYVEKEVPEEVPEQVPTTPAPGPHNPDKYAGNARVGQGEIRPGLSDPFAGTTWGKS